jgi:RNA polymerase sigma-70 factor (ECF subfamily)
MILLKDYEGYSYAEIANILEVNEGQVKINIFRARKKLKALILSPQQNAAK